MTLPSEFEARMKGLLGEEWEAFRSALQEEGCRGLRVNSLKAAGLPECVLPGPPDPVPWAADGYYYKEETRPGKHVYHEMGLYYIQEPSAMSAAELLGARPGERVLDLCAAPGGKSTQIAAAMRGEGLLVSNEVHPERCRILSRNIERMGIPNALVISEEPARLAERFPSFFHRILVDAPCSGEGMFRRSPQALEEWSPQRTDGCAGRQAEILEQAADMLAPGGRLVYSTCTFSPKENEGVIGGFLKAHPEFHTVSADCPWFAPGNPAWGNGDPALADTFRLWPHRLRGEGHYAAVLEKKPGGAGGGPKEKGALPRGNAPLKKGRRRERRNGMGGVHPDRRQRQEVEELLLQILSKESVEFLKREEWILFGEQLYRLPGALPELDKIRLLRAGLHIGAWKKNRLEPSHALALFLKKEEVLNYVNLSSEKRQAGAYFHGETLEGISGEEGWNLVCVDGYSAGWGKLSGGRLKNHYPKGLRL